MRISFMYTVTLIIEVCLNGKKSIEGRRIVDMPIPPCVGMTLCESGTGGDDEKIKAVFYNITSGTVETYLSEINVEELVNDHNERFPDKSITPEEEWARLKAHFSDDWTFAPVT